MFETQDVTGASPLCGRSAADFFWHFQKNLDLRTDNQGRVGAEKDSTSERFSDSALRSLQPDFQARTRSLVFKR